MVAGVEEDGQMATASEPQANGTAGEAAPENGKLTAAQKKKLQKKRRKQERRSERCGPGRDHAAAMHQPSHPTATHRSRGAYGLSP